MNHRKKILDTRRADTGVEDFSGAVVEGPEGVRRLREGKPLAQG
jgi:simple sugar transport system ATP-binding protein